MLTLIAVTALPSLAQSSLVATLVHDGNISTYYSANALKDAYNAAVDGDIITLSAGTFNATDITKRITIRGAGSELDKNPTILSGQFEIKNGEGDLEQQLLMEGIRAENFRCHSLTNATFLKCEFTTNQISIGGETSYSSSNLLTNVNFIHCIIDNIISKNGDIIAFNNCVINTFRSENNTEKVIEVNNCIVKNIDGYSSGFGIGIYLYGTTCTNSFLHTTKNGNDINARLINCIYCGPESWINCENVNCKTVSYDIEPFENGYHLKSEYASEWLGNDGKEIGIYGGSLPYDPTTTNPQISKFNVSSKTTADGKLSVDIEVKAE